MLSIKRETRAEINKILILTLVCSCLWHFIWILIFFFIFNVTILSNKGIFKKKHQSKSHKSSYCKVYCISTFSISVQKFYWPIASAVIMSCLWYSMLCIYVFTLYVYCAVFFLCTYLQYYFTNTVTLSLWLLDCCLSLLSVR